MNSISVRARVVWCLLRSEIHQNKLIYLLPLPFFLILFVRLLIVGQTYAPGTRASTAMLVAGAILAIVYGQQAFAAESDRKTLDFLLSRPVSAALLTAVKYLTNMGVYLGWLALSASCLRLDLSRLPVADASASAWVVFCLLTLAGMSFLAGLLTRGAERLLATVLLAGGFAGACYALWNRVLALAAARFFWTDVPPHVYGLIAIGLPMILLICVLLTPPVVAQWLLRGRTAMLRYRPLWRLLIVWGTLLLVVEGARATLGPSVWPLPHEFADGGTGDWHPRVGVVVAGPAIGGRVDDLAVARLGGRARVIYRGRRLHSPRWAPDGKAVAFVEDGWIKVLRGRQVVRIARGNYPSWAADGESLVYAETAGRDYKARAIWRASIRAGTRERIWERETKPLGLVWDSVRARLFIFDRDGTLREIDLRQRTETSMPIPTPVQIIMQNPWGTLGPDGDLYLSVSYGREAHLFIYCPGEGEVKAFDDVSGRVSPVLPVFISPAERGYLWPRTDRAYEYRGFLPEHDHDHEHDEE